MKLTSQLRNSGISFLPALLLPALAGTLLPFRLESSGFSFSFTPAILFLLCLTLFHLGCGSLHTSLNCRKLSGQNKKYFFRAGVFLWLISIPLIVYLHLNMPVRSGVFPGIFLVYCLTAFLVVLLYLIPPVSFHKRAGREVLLSVGYGSMPVIGAYLVQVGDLHRPVYLVSLLMVLATALLIWLDELISKRSALDSRPSLISLFSNGFASRIVPVILIILIYLFLLCLVFLYPVLSPVSLLSLLSLFWSVPIIKNLTLQRVQDGLPKLRQYAGYIYLTVCLSIILSSIF